MESAEDRRCSECYAIFTRRTNMLAHMRQKHSVFIIKPQDHKCPDCGQLFTMKKNMVAHMRKKHHYSKESTTKDSKCPHCNSMFTMKKNMLAHIRNKHAAIIQNQRKYHKCPQCSQGFIREKNIPGHMRKKHGLITEVSNKVPAKKDKVSSNVDDYLLLKKIIPERDGYVVENYVPLKINGLTISETWFKATIHFRCPSIGALKQWKEEFESINKLSLRVKPIYKSEYSVLEYKKYYRCHHNTVTTRRKKANEKHTSCMAAIHLELFHKVATVFIKHAHNHPLNTIEILQFRLPSDDVKNKFKSMFESNMSISEALSKHRSDIKAEYGSNLRQVLFDRYYMPDYKWVHQLYCTVQEELRRKNDRGMVGPLKSVTILNVDESSDADSNPSVTTYELPEATDVAYLDTASDVLVVFNNDNQFFRDNIFKK